MKIDPYKHKEKYIGWREKVKDGIPETSKENSDLFLQYLTDMEKGINIAAGSVNGARSYARLDSLKSRLIFFAKKFKEICGTNSIKDIREEQLLSFFSDIKSGVIKKAKGGIYKSVDTYAKIFSAFWHWHQKVNRKKGVQRPDGTWFGVPFYDLVVEQIKEFQEADLLHNEPLEDILNQIF